MFRRAICSVALFIVVLGLPLWAWSARISLNNSYHPHNLSNSGTSNNFMAIYETRICIFCHAPHNASTEGQLWNKDTYQDGYYPSLGISSSGWSIYGDDGSTPGAGIQIDTIAAAKYGESYGEYPNGATRICMSCHDGVTAMGYTITEDYILFDNVLGSGDYMLSSPGGKDIPKSQFIDLHPVSFVYDDAVRTDLNAFYGAGSYLAPNQEKARLDGQGRMQCTTCHDPHVWDDSDNNPPMWRNYVAGRPDEADTCDQCHAGSAPSFGHP